MAGVGFELKKLFKEKGSYVTSVKAYAISSIVTQGPMLLSICMLFMLRSLLVYFKSSYIQQEIFLITITYIMIFSMLIANSVLFFVSRYISDCIFEKKYNKILSAFYGVTTVLLILGGTIASIFIFTLELDIFFKILSMALYGIVLIVWIQLSFLSAIRRYAQILIGFSLALVCSIITAFGLMRLGANPLMSAMIGFTLGYFVIMISFMMILIKHYPAGTSNPFEFIGRLDKYKSLVFIGFFMTIGLFGHNFIMWTSEYSTLVLERLRYSLIYDIPAFYACLTIMPMMVIFVVSLEVNFYQKYRDYFDSILNGGRLEDIQNSHKSMKVVLLREIGHMLEVQLFFTIFCVGFLGNFLQLLGLDSNMLGIFRILCFGYCFYGLENCVTIILLYFDDRKGALVSSFIFASVSMIATIIMKYQGIEYYGLGFLIGTFVSSLYALVRCYFYLRRLEYHVFCNQPLFYEEKIGFFTKIINKLNLS